MPAFATKSPSSSVHRPSLNKHRGPRRRGRANSFHSVDEIVREQRSDSDTDEDDQSSADSETDSETEPASEDVPHHGHPSLLSLGTTPPVVNDGKVEDGSAPLLTASVTWSEMVTDQVANGTTDLPVIDFADLDNTPIHAKASHPPVPRKLPKSKRPPPHRRSSAPPMPSEPPFEPPMAPPSPSLSPSPAEPITLSASAPLRRGQTARQAYQERLENDPSYVPTVGDFWGHDDRLLDKDLRSLSGWWRVRWQGGARGRSFGVRGRGLGRGPAPGRGGASTAHDSHPSPDSSSLSQVDVPPVERPWTHDGFEELKRRDEQRTLRQDQSQGPNGNSRGSRGRSTPRGRAFGRGRFSPRPGTTRSTESPSSMTSRTWFLVKPERPWTKHHELFLYSDPSQRTRPGQGPTYRVKLSGTSPEAIVHSSTTQRPPPRAPTPPREVSHEDGVVFIVSLPRSARKPEVAESTPTPAAAPSPPSPIPVPSPEQMVDAAASVQVSSPSISPAVPAIVVKPESPPELHVTIEEQLPVASSEPPADDPFKLRDPPPPTIIPLPTTTSTQVNPVASVSGAAISPSVPPNIAHSATAPEGGLLWRSPPPHLQTTFAQSASAPGYTSPYTYGPVSTPTVPPGVALDAHGMPYELATGRPLYLAAPPQVHTPVYMMPYPHLPSHMQHRPHASPDPSLFAPPRQSSRIEIRRPDGSLEESRLSSTHTQTYVSRPSALRTSTSAPAFIPSHAPAAQAPPAPHEFYPSPPPEAATAPAPAAVMGYPAYAPPPYYAYGAAEGYAYPPPQFVEYDAYNADPRGAAPASTQAVYY
jgi:hypothetical protein